MTSVINFCHFSHVPLRLYNSMFQKARWVNTDYSIASSGLAFVKLTISNKNTLI